MIKKLSKHGNSFAVIIDKPILDLLKINDQTELEIATDGNNIIIKPIEKLDISKISDDEKLQKIYEKLIKKYGSALKKLAHEDE